MLCLPDRIGMMRSMRISLGRAVLGRAVLGCAVLTSVLLVAGPGVGAAAPCPVALVEVAHQAGVDFQHDNGAQGEKHLPETMGAGVVWLDVDGDGWLDLYAVQSGPYPGHGDAAAANRLWRGRGDGSFVAVAEAGGAGDRGYGQGAVAADVDGDGAVDLYVANEGPDALYRNRGDGSFENVTAHAFGRSVPGGWSSSAAFGDLDGDGNLDLYVARYLVYGTDHDRFCGDFEQGTRDYCGPELFDGVPDVLMRGIGDGRFEDQSIRAGIAKVAGKGLGVVVVDLDGDRHPEIYVANDETVNLLFSRRGDGSFEDLSFLAGAGVNRQGLPEAGMGVAVGDVDGDGRPDLAVTNFDVETNTLYRNRGDLQFDDESISSGFGQPSFNLLGFGVALVDLDLDGVLDAYVTNGHVRVKPRREQVRHAQADLVMLGAGSGRFRAVPCAVPAERAYVGRGLAWADYDDDGDPDLAVSNNAGPLQIWRNQAQRHPWLGVRLLGRTPNTEAVGAVVRLRERSGRWQTRWITAGDSYQSSSDRRALFALADEPTQLEVVWPSGRKTRLRAPPVGHYLSLREPLPAVNPGRAPEVAGGAAEGSS